MSAERARRRGVAAPVPILGWGQGNVSSDVPLRRDMTKTRAGASAEAAFAMAGVARSDIDVAQIHDCFTITALMTLTEYGLLPPGDGRSWIDEGTFEVGGALPLDTAGGLLSETGLPGLQLVLEAVARRGQFVLGWDRPRFGYCWRVHGTGGHVS